MKAKFCGPPTPSSDELPRNTLWLEGSGISTGPVPLTLGLISCGNTLTQYDRERISSLFFSIRSLLTKRGEMESLVLEAPFSS